MEQKTEENIQEQPAKDFATAAKDAVLCGAQTLKRKMSGGKCKLDWSEAGQIAGMLRVMGSIIIIMGFFGLGFFEGIITVGSRFSSDATLKGWLYSFGTGLALGLPLWGLGSIISLLQRIAASLESRKEK